jgi:nicotinate-nucleotide adenylyltransferase
LLFVPTRGSHYRVPPVATIDERLAMLRGALAANPHFGIDETDLGEDASGYTADLMPRLRARYPHDELTFVVGGDSLVDSPWQRFETVLANLERFAIAPRAERQPERVESFLGSLLPAERAKFVVLDLPALNGSATLVRQQLARGGSIRYLVPEPVYRYLEEHDIYGRAAPVADGA